jgi:hypothetical protein
MNSPDFPIVLFTILSFFAGFACAIWLAIAYDQGAREIAEKAAEDNPPQGG